MPELRRLGPAYFLGPLILVNPSLPVGLLKTAIIFVFVRRASYPEVVRAIDVSAPRVGTMTVGTLAPENTALGIQASGQL